MNKWTRYGLATLAVAAAATAFVAMAAEPGASKPDISLASPGIRTIQSRMQVRFDEQLKIYFGTGALGFTRDGLIEVRDASAIPMAQRTKVAALVAEDNRDRKAVYREVAVANGHPEWEARIRTIFAQQWIDSARGGWWYQIPAGTWAQK